MSNWKDRIALIQGDITAQSVDVIVNAANNQLTHGGGVCGAIHTAAGPALERECLQIGDCPTGEAVITDAYDLPCKKVIHTVGPIYGGGADDLEEELLASCYYNSMRLAAANNLSSIAFPGLSTGIYGYPFAAACRIALATLKESLNEHPEIHEVILVCFSSGDLEEYERKFEEME